MRLRLPFGYRMQKGEYRNECPLLISLSLKGYSDEYIRLDWKMPLRRFLVSRACRVGNVQSFAVEYSRTRNFCNVADAVRSIDLG